MEQANENPVQHVEGDATAERAEVVAEDVHGFFTPVPIPKLPRTTLVGDGIGPDRTALRLNAPGRSAPPTFGVGGAP